MAVGDSITAAAFAKGPGCIATPRVILIANGSWTRVGFRPILHNSFAEWRGVSYAAGMDDGALTVPNVSKRYAFLIARYSRSLPDSKGLV